MLEPGAEGLQRGRDGFDASGVEKSEGGHFEDDPLVVAVVDQPLEEVPPGHDVVDERLVVAAAMNVVAVDVADPAQQDLRRMDRTAVIVRVPVGMAEIPAGGNVALGGDLQQFVVSVADAMPRFVGFGTELKLDGHSDLGRVATAPIACPREEGDRPLDEVAAGDGRWAGRAVNVHERRGLLALRRLGSLREEPLVKESAGVVRAVGEVRRIEDAALGIRVHRHLHPRADAAGDVLAQGVGPGLGPHGRLGHLDTQFSQERQDISLAVQPTVVLVL